MKKKLIKKKMVDEWYAVRIYYLNKMSLISFDKYLNKYRVKEASLARIIDFHSNYQKWARIKLGFNTFPVYKEISAKLRKLKNGCGPASIWMILSFFNNNLPASQIIKLCKCGKRGTYTIDVAVTFLLLGYKVVFYHEKDPKITKREINTFIKAKSLGLKDKKTVSLNTIIKKIDKKNIPVFTFLEGKSGHFSPCIGILDDDLVLPYAHKYHISKSSFPQLWKNNKTFSECLIISKT